MIPFDKSITDQNLKKIMNKVNVYAYAPGEPLLYTEQKKNAVYYIYKGIVKVRQNNVTFNENNPCMKEIVDENLIEYWSKCLFHLIHLLQCNPGSKNGK